MQTKSRVQFKSQQEHNAWTCEQIEKFKKKVKQVKTITRCFLTSLHSTIKSTRLSELDEKKIKC